MVKLFIVYAALMCSLSVPANKKAAMQPAEEKMYLPLAFGNDTLNIRQDKMSRAYIAPKKVIWSQGTIRNLENLLNDKGGRHFHNP